MSCLLLGTGQNLVYTQGIDAPAVTPVVPEPRTSTASANPPPSFFALRKNSQCTPAIRDLIRRCLEMDGLHLGYQYGSADPQNGAMDCSGTVFYVLRQSGLKNVPRQADGFYRWVWDEKLFFAVNSTNFDSFEWMQLHPGDLLFWTGTYDVKRNPPVSHVMIYLGEDETTGRRLMFGASENRRYGVARKSGVGVFDFDLPKPDASGTGSRFIGYARIPGLQ